MTLPFEQLGVRETFAKRLQEMNIVEPVQVQTEAIPKLLEGRDAVIESSTGSGKTLAYLLPIAEKLSPDEKETQAVVVVPTRELGMQITRVAQDLFEGTALRIQPLIGGAAVGRQVEKLREHPHLVVGTPGRILELIKMRKLKMHRVRTIVVDEVDQVFDLGGAREIEDIIRSAVRDRQLVFVSATMTAAIRGTADRWMPDPELIRTEGLGREAEPVEHLAFVCQEREKVDLLRKLVRHMAPRAAMVFVNQTEDIGGIAGKLDFHGIRVEALYADSDKQTRAAVLHRFREGKAQVLVATDIAARGLDVEGVTHVFHFDPATDAEHYVHRAGRTGRMGRKGTVVSIVTDRQRFILDKFAKELGIRFEERVLFEGHVLRPEELPKRKRTALQEKPRAGAGAPNGAKGEVDLRGKPAVKTADHRAGAGQRTPAGEARGSGTASAAAGKTSLPAGKPKARKSEREQDRKNKGAPKWLKEKRQNPTT